jgi:uncharacterized protein (TIGR03083 family)
MDPTTSLIEVPEVPDVPRPRLVEAWRTVGSAVVNLLGQEGLDPARRVAGLDWTVGQLGAHLMVNLEFGSDVLHGKGSPATTMNSAEIAALNQSANDVVLRRGGDQVGQLETALQGWLALLSTETLPPTVPYHGGLQLPPLRVAACLLFEYLVHGYDLATTLGRPWHIDPEHVDLAMRGVTTVMPLAVDTERARGFSATYRLRLRGQGSYTFRFDDGRLTVGGAYEGPVDCRISADPATYLLVAMGRLSPIRPALTGRMVVYGRRPWLGLRFSRLVAAP